MTYRPDTHLKKNVKVYIVLKPVCVNDVCLCVCIWPFPNHLFIEFILRIMLFQTILPDL